MKCPKCKGNLSKKTGKYGVFYGCSNFPKCRHTQKYMPKTVTKKYTPIDLSTVELSQYQLDILDAAQNTQDNLAVQATAGSGKSFTLRLIAQQITQYKKPVYATFDKRSVTDIQSEINPSVHVATWHSVGFKNVRNSIKNCRVDNGKNRRILNEILDNFDQRYREKGKSEFSNILKLVSWSKNTLQKISLDSALDGGVAFDPDNDIAFLLDISQQVFAQSVRDAEAGTVDFDDMIFLPATDRVPVTREFDLVLCDESQDLNNAQLNLVAKSGSRYIIVGDSNQAIYLFRGADISSMDILSSEFDCVELPLSISYRNPLSHIEYINNRFPYIQHEKWDNASEGQITEINKEYFSPTEGDLILCRVNAPLVPGALSLIRDGIPAYVAGKNIGKGLIKLVERCEKKTQKQTLDAVLTKMDEYVREQEIFLRSKGRSPEYILDQRDTIHAVADSNGFDSVAGLKNQIDTLFDDNGNGVQFSTIHRAKGSESENVYILRPDLLEHPKGNPIEEKNVAFVGCTRSKQNMTFVTGGEK